MTITGTVQQIVANKIGWAAVILKDVPQKVLIENGVFTDTLPAAGVILDPVVGAKLQLTGDFTVHPKFGKQFKVSFCVIDTQSEESILAYLSSGFIKGVGNALAQRIVDKFKDKTLDIIESDYPRLVEVKGISTKKARDIYEAHQKSSVYRKLIEKFNGLATQSKILKIYEKYRDNSITVIEDNPYQLLYDIDGFGFKTVDALAQKAGIQKDDPRRIQGCIAYILDEMAQKSGHCFLNIDDLLSNVLSYIESDSVSNEILTDAVVKLVSEKKLIVEGENLYLRKYWYAEKELTQRINALLVSSMSTIYDEKIVQEIVEGMKWQTNPVNIEGKQLEAIQTSLNNHLSIITGGPGTGKTTIIKALVKIAKKRHYLIKLLAPTGRAACRLAEATGMEATTIHSLIKIKEQDEIKSVPCKRTLFVVDEASMVDILVAKELMNLTDSSCCVVLVGDIDQLPPIGAGNFFRDLALLKCIPTTKLSLSHRFGGVIATNAHLINSGSARLKENADFEIIRAETPEERQTALLESYFRNLRELGGDFKDIQIIVPQRQKGPCCANQLNKLIREKVNPLKAGGSQFGPERFRVGDRVMVTANNNALHIANGDCGVVTEIDNETAKITLMMDADDRIISLSDLSAEALVLAYAITVHKSQGSEYKRVISAYGMNDYIMLQRNLLYTAVTRAKERCVLITDSRAIYVAVSNIKPCIRNTALAEKILLSLKK